MTDPQLNSIYLLGVGGAVSAPGHFVDGSGNQVGVSFAGTTAIPGAGGTPKKLTTLYTGGVVPSGAVGARIRLSADVYMATISDGDGVALADFTTNYANYPKVIADPEWNEFGSGF